MPAGRPNVLLITSDQHRSDSLACYGHPFIMTPHLDQLAFEGVRFTNAYTDCPVCIPARTTLITGIQSHVYGMPSYAERHRIERPRELFLGSLMTRAGYQTELIGKRHWHTDPGFRAGFEHADEMPELRRLHEAHSGQFHGTTGVGANEIHPALSHFPPHLYRVNHLVDRAIDFVRCRDRTQPFFLWTSFEDPHPPLVIREPFYSMYDGEEVPAPSSPGWAEPARCPRAIHMHRLMYNASPMSPGAVRKARSVYWGIVTNLDFQLGRLFAALMEAGVWADTLVLYTTDHGEHLGDVGNVAKSSFLECSAGLPFIVRPHAAMRRETGVEPGRASDALVELADLLPTFCELADVDAPADVTGRSLVPILRGEAARVRDSLHGQIDESHMFHDGRHKYLYFTDDGSELVFDKTADPRDESDLSGDAALTARLREAFRAHLAGEGHKDLVAGELRNDHKPRPSDATVRSWNPMGWHRALRT